MKKENSLIALILCTVIALFILAIYVYSASQTTDLAKLGSFFGGIGSVLIGVITTIVLIVTLFRQEKVNEDAAIKNESEFILSLYSQMERDFDNLYFKYKQGGVTLTFKGQEALDENVLSNAFTDYPENLNRYQDSFTAMQLHGVLKSFDLIKSRCKSLSPTLFNVLDDKLNIFYSAKLEHTCKCFNEVFIKNNTVLDDKAKYLVQFYNKHKDITL
jgi:hypothetical protein